MDKDISDLKFFTIEDNSLGDLDLMVARAGFTGELGYELYVQSDKKEVLEEKIKEAIEKYRDHKDMVMGPNFWGVTENGRDFYKMALVYYTRQGQQYDLEFALRSEIIKTMQRENIDPPMIRNKFIKGEIEDALL